MDTLVNDEFADFVAGAINDAFYDDYRDNMRMVISVHWIHLPLRPLPLCHGGFASFSRSQSETNAPSNFFLETELSKKLVFSSG